MQFKMGEYFSQKLSPWVLLKCNFGVTPNLFVEKISFAKVYKGIIIIIDRHYNLAF